jgi:protein involved in polysaccharide export with SLBB domain
MAQGPRSRGEGMPAFGVPVRGVLVFAVLLAAGCSATRMRADLDLHQPHPGSAPIGDLMGERDRSALAALGSARSTQGRDGYRIGADDLLDIRIPKLLSAQAGGATAAPATGATLPSLAAAPVFQQGVRVSAAGDVTLPLIGSVPAVGRTPAELEQDIARRLVSGGILVNPQVSVQIAEHRSNVVAVVGSVERPGLYPVTRPNATIADFIWAAGGPNKDAGRIVDFAPASTRTERGEPIVIDLALLLRDRGAGANPLNPLNPVAVPGDVLTVAPAGSVQVDGWVEKPGSYPVTRGLTLTGAIAAAGGHLFPADRQQVMVKRTLGAASEQKILTVDIDAITAGRATDVSMTDGDVVHLPAAPERLVPYTVYEVGKDMIRIGGNVLLF